MLHLPLLAMHLKRFELHPQFPLPLLVLLQVPLQFEIMLDTVTFQNIYNVASIKDKFNLEIKLKIRKNSIFPEEKKHNCIELLRLDVTDLKLV